MLNPMQLQRPPGLFKPASRCFAGLSQAFIPVARQLADSSVKNRKRPAQLPDRLIVRSIEPLPFLANQSCNHN
jgi:hypothetical protein